MSDGGDILDSSVFLAILNDETYDPYILDVLEGAVMSTVNCAEVWTKLHEFGATDHPQVKVLFGLLSRIEPFSETQARLTGDLRPLTRHVGLSLGDRACLALTIEQGATVHTAEHKWAELNLPCHIRLIRKKDSPQGIT